MATATIKVNRLALIAKLEEAKVRIMSEADKSVKDYEAYQVAIKKWAEQAIKHADTVSHYHSNEFRFSVKVSYLKEKPKEPTNPNQTSWERGKSYTSLSLAKEAVKEIDQAISLLNLCEDTTVPQSLVKTVAQYLG